MSNTLIKGMRISSVYLSDMHLKYIKMLCTTDPRTYPSKSECVRSAVNDWLIKQVELRNAIAKELNEFNKNNHDRVRVPIIPNPDIEYKEYKIVKRLEF